MLGLADADLFELLRRGRAIGLARLLFRLWLWLRRRARRRSAGAGRRGDHAFTSSMTAKTSGISDPSRVGAKSGCAIFTCQQFDSHSYHTPYRAASRGTLVTRTRPASTSSNSSPVNFSRILRRSRMASSSGVSGSGSSIGLGAVIEGPQRATISSGVSPSLADIFSLFIVIGVRIIRRCRLRPQFNRQIRVLHKYPSTPADVL